MKDIIIRCIVTDSINNYKFKITIYDEKNATIIDKVDNNLKIKLKYGLYKVIIKPLDKIYPCCISRYIYISKCIDKKYIFYFKENLKRKITIKLLEKGKIKIEKGEIILWPKI